MVYITNNIQKAKEELNKKLNIDSVFDIITEDLEIGNRLSVYYFINGYIDTKTVQKIHAGLIAITESEMEKIPDYETFLRKKLPFSDIFVTDDSSVAKDSVLRGSLVIFIDGFDKWACLDVRSFQSRGIDEPEKNRTLRGAHDAFNENLISNLILIRRHLRTEDLETKKITLGKNVKNDVAVLSIKGKYDKKLMDKIIRSLNTAKINSLSMTQETLASVLYPNKKLSYLNPFPRVRYTERPDTVSAVLLEGKIVLICDNSPSAMILPLNLYDFIEETDDYYFPPFTSTYLRCIRFFVFIASVFFVPIWLFFAENGGIPIKGFDFIFNTDNFYVPLYLQFLIIEFAIDGLKMASLNTPDALANSLSIVGGLLLGDFAIKSGWFIPQTILYSSLTAIANFVPSNYELGYSFKFMRISLIISVHFFKIRGIVIVSLIWIIMLISMRYIAEKDYLYPIFPFDRKALMKVFIKTEKGKESIPK